MPCATTLRAVPSTRSDAVFSHNPHAPYGLLRRLGICFVSAPPRYERFRLRRAALDLRGTRRRSKADLRGTRRRRVRRS